MKKIHRAWKVCLGCALLIFCTSGLVTNAFSIYLPYILSYNHFSNTQVSTLLTARSLTSFISMFLTGIYYEHIDLRKGMALSGIFVAIGFFLYGISINYAMYFIAAIIVGIGYGLGSMVPIGIILNRWFETNLSFATGICACATGLSTLGLPTLITILIGNIGLSNTFFAESILIAIMIFISYLLISNSPQEARCEAYHKAEYKKKATTDVKTFSTKYNPIMKGKIWLLLVPVTLCIGGFTSTAYCHLSVFMTSTGISAKDASIVILASGLAVTSSKFIYGWVADRVSAYRSNWIFGSLSILGLLFCLFTKGNALLMGISIVIYSLGLGMTTVGLVVWAHELSKPEDFDENNRRLQVGYAAGGLMFSSIPGILADHNNGSYQTAILMFLIIAIFVLFSIQIIYKKAKISN